jgi:hypothetical protein
MAYKFICHTCINDNSTGQCLYTANVAAFVIEMLLRDSKILEVDIGEMQRAASSGLET